MKLIANHVLHKCDHHLVTKLTRSLCLSHSYGGLQASHRMGFGRHRYRRKTFGGHMFDDLFPWESLTEFSRYLADHKLYFDGKLLAIDKPWGVGIYKPVVNINDKNSHLSTSLYSGSPNYCITDTLQHLCQIFDTRGLRVVKSLERFMSGIVLLATDEDTEKRVIKSFGRAHGLQVPARTFWCVTSGWPTNPGASLRERVGIKLVELDELGDHKQPIIIPPQQLTEKMRRRKDPQSDGMIVKPALIDLKCIDVNKTLGVALVELSANVTRWNFIECYLAHKASFVLGDTRFSKQVKHILGTPLTVRPDKINFSQDLEPLHSRIRNRLEVRSNGNIPVLVHHKRLVLPYYLSKKQHEDLVIEANQLPPQFDWSVRQLDLKVPR